MEQDSRIGLALGILLLGVVGALFFRNERTVSDAPPAVADPDALNARLAERSMAPYVPTGDDSGRLDPVEAHNRQIWQMPDFLKEKRRALARKTPPEPLRPKPAEAAARPGGSLSPTPSADRVATKPAPVRPRAAAKPSASPATPVQQPAAGVAQAGTSKSMPKPKPDLMEYQVRPGDTLSDIAARFLGSSTRYMDIYELNRDRLRSPHDLRIGRSIRVPRRQ